jgi:hypothetical protein
MSLYDKNKIFILSEKHQRRTHRKKRINKKWLKRYGITGILEPGQIIMLANGYVCMSKKSYNQIKKFSKKEETENNDPD